MDLPAWIQAVASVVALIVASLAYKASLNAETIAQKGLIVNQQQQRRQNAVDLINNFNVSIANNAYYEIRYINFEDNPIKKVYGQQVIEKIMNNILYWDCRYYEIENKTRCLHHLKAYEENIFEGKSLENKYYDPLAFWERKPDKGLILDCCSHFEMMFREIEKETADFDTINFELGQIMEGFFLLLDVTAESRQKLQKHYPSFYNYYFRQAPQVFADNNYLTKTSFEPKLGNDEMYEGYSKN